MKAIIPAAGYATRLYPLTLNTPKQLLKVGDKRMLEHILHKIEEVKNIDHIYIVTNNKFYNHFLGWKKTFSSSIPITILNDMTMSNEDRLGAVGDIHFAVDKCSIDDDCLVIGGDNLFEFSLNHMIDYFKEKDSSIIAVRDLYDKRKLANKFGVVEIDENLRITGFEEKPAQPRSTLTATMVYIFKRDDIAKLHNIMKTSKPDNSGDFIKHLSETSTVHCYIFDENWYDLGSHEQLEEVNQIYRSDNR